MLEPIIKLQYRFLSTGDFKDENNENKSINVAHLLFSRFLGSLKQIKQAGSSIEKCIIDFRMTFNPTEKTKISNALKSILTFSFHLDSTVDKSEIKGIQNELSEYCESLLTFTFRRRNFTIELAEEDEFEFDKVLHIIEILKPLEMASKHSRLTPEKIDYPVNVGKLANLMLRAETPLGYAVTIDVHGWDEKEVSLLLQGGIQTIDPLSKFGTQFASPFSEEDEDKLSSNAEKPVCKVRFFSTQNLSSFYVSELLECISTGKFPKTSKLEKSKPELFEEFSNELTEIRNYFVTGESPIHIPIKLEPLIIKVYRSLGIEEIANVSPIPRQPIPGIEHKKYTSFYPSITELSPNGIILGSVRTEASIGHTEVRISDKDRLRHLYVIGKTGTGKSSFLGSMIIQDILDSRASIVLDPHGELCDEMISALPEKFLDNVILIDPTKSPEFNGCSLNVLDISTAKGESELIAMPNPVNSNT